MLDGLTTFAEALAGGFVGAFVAVTFRFWLRLPHRPERLAADGHEHQWGRVTGDGKGWRCVVQVGNTVCNELQNPAARPRWRRG